MLRRILSTFHHQRRSQSNGALDALRKSIEAMDKMIGEKFEAMDKKFGEKFEAMDKRFDSIETKVKTTNRQLQILLSSRGHTLEVMTRKFGAAQIALHDGRKLLPPSIHKSIQFHHGTLTDWLDQLKKLEILKVPPKDIFKVIDRLVNSRILNHEGKVIDCSTLEFDATAFFTPIETPDKYIICHLSMEVKASASLENLAKQLAQSIRVPMLLHEMARNGQVPAVFPLNTMALCAYFQVHRNPMSREPKMINTLLNKMSMVCAHTPTDHLHQLRATTQGTTHVSDNDSTFNTPIDPAPPTSPSAELENVKAPLPLQKNRKSDAPERRKLAPAESSERSYYEMIHVLEAFIHSRCLENNFDPNVTIDDATNAGGVLECYAGFHRSKLSGLTVSEWFDYSKSAHMKSKDPQARTDISEICSVWSILNTLRLAKSANIGHIHSCKLKESLLRE
jgi:hypothetical protein